MSICADATVMKNQASEGRNCDLQFRSGPDRAVEAAAAAAAAADHLLTTDANERRVLTKKGWREVCAPAGGATAFCGWGASRRCITMLVRNATAPRGTRPFCALSVYVTRCVLTVH